MTRTRRLAAPAAMIIGIVAGTAPGMAGAASARSDLYSVAAVNRYCTEAQKVTANTTLASENIVHLGRIKYPPRGSPQPDILDFVFSSAAPYEGNNLSAYNGKANVGPLLSLTTQQLVSYRAVPLTDYEIPVVISCKMKSAEGVQFHFGTAAAGAQASCKTMNQRTVTSVFATLTTSERRYLRYTEAQVVFDDDIPAPSGPAWLASIPVLLPDPIYIDGGLVHILSSSIAVPVVFEDPNIGPDKKGSFYCHFPSPEYIRSVVTGQVLPFS